MIGPNNSWVSGADIAVLRNTPRREIPLVMLDPPSDPLRCSRGVGLALAICVPGWMLLGVILWAVCR
jgi:hypothetical protein